MSQCPFTSNGCTGGLGLVGSGMDAGLGGRAWRCLVSVLLPGPQLFLKEFLNHPDHIFKTTLEHIGFSSLSLMVRNKI